MRLTDKTIAGLTIPKGKSELLVFDDDLPGFRPSAARRRLPQVDIPVSA
jgi:hypothetical protein